MATWQDGSEYAPQAAPFGFETPLAEPLEAGVVSEEVSMLNGTTSAVAPADYVAGDSGPDLELVTPAPPETRDATQPFETSSAGLGQAAAERDPHAPFNITNGATWKANDSMPDFAPPTGAPVVAVGTVGAVGATGVAGTPAAASYPPPTGAAVGGVGNTAGGAPVAGRAPQPAWNSPITPPAPSAGGYAGAPQAVVRDQFGRLIRPAGPGAPGATAAEQQLAGMRQQYPTAAPGQYPPPQATPYAPGAAGGMPPQGAQAGQGQGYSGPYLAPGQPIQPPGMEPLNPTDVTIGNLIKAIGWPVILSLVAGFIFPPMSWLMLALAIILSSQIKVAVRHVRSMYRGAIYVYLASWVLNIMVNYGVDWVPYNISQIISRALCVLLLLATFALGWTDMRKRAGLMQ